MKYNKIIALLSLYGKNLTDLAEHMGVAKQQVTNKKKNDSFKADDLIKAANLTGTQLAFVDKKGDVVIKFDLSDLQKDDKKST